jgi:cytoskeletal protein CcmA (bactofilin family)
VTIDKKGHVVSDVRCVSLILKGKLKGDVVSLAKVEVAGDAELKGDVTASSLSIEPGAMMEGFYRIGPKPTEPPPAKVVEGAKEEIAAANSQVAEPAGEPGVAPAPTEAPKAPIVIKVPVRKTATVTRRQ